MFVPEQKMSCSSVTSDPGLSYHYYSNSSLTTVTEAAEKIDWRRLKSHLIRRRLIKGHSLGLKHYQHGENGGWEEPERLSADPCSSTGEISFYYDNSGKIWTCAKTFRMRSSSTSRRQYTVRTGASPPPLISVCCPLWSYCEDRRAPPAPHSFIYFTVFHLHHHQSASEGNPLCVSHRCHLGLIPWN